MPALVSAPDWLRVQFSVDGVAVTVSHAMAPVHPRTLDLRRGMLLSAWMLRDAHGRLARLRALRCVSAADRSLAVQVMQLEVDRPLWLELEASLVSVGDGLQPVVEAGRVDADSPVHVWRTAHADRFLGVGTAVTLRRDSTEVVPEPADTSPGWRWVATPDEPTLFTRIVSMARAEAAPAAASEAHVALQRGRRAGVARIVASHTRTLERRWAASDVVVEGDEDAQRGLRFAIHHLISSANPEDEHVSIGARALTGEGYLGHVFWDTEIFLLPFYIYTWPAAARALLMYRYHTLPAARAKAAGLGYCGALYAWESAESGEETTPPWVIGPDGQVVPVRCGVEEHHISADIAYAVWQYWQATRDVRFLLEAGAEILLETARFWASRARREVDGRYHIRSVIGPDEYHEGVDDNAYTNRMARWNIERGLEVAAKVAQRWPERWQSLSGALSLSAEELRHWKAAAIGLELGSRRADGVVEQFTGYFGLEDIDLAGYTTRPVPIDVLLGSERVRGSQVIKQPDVVMLLALLWQQFTSGEREANFRYYEPRCGHGSSLSPALHALVAAQLGDTDLAQSYFTQALAIDLGDTMGSAAGGVHIAALGGMWQAAVFGFAGMQPDENTLRFDPHLPDDWQTLHFSVQWRGRTLSVRMESHPSRCTLNLVRGRPLSVSVGDLGRRLLRDVPWSVGWDRHTRRWSERTS
jgi:trehalose/maltose hydrolase-like predicted phosphorylase